MASISGLPGVSAAGGGLAVTDLRAFGTIPSPASRSSGTAQTSINTDSFSILGAAVSAGRVGPLSSVRLTAGRTFTSADADGTVALPDADYAV